jgi:hypothetical protein
MHGPLRLENVDRFHGVDFVEVFDQLVVFIRNDALLVQQAHQNFDQRDAIFDIAESDRFVMIVGQIVGEDKNQSANIEVEVDKIVKLDALLEIRLFDQHLEACQAFKAIYEVVGVFYILGSADLEKSLHFFF